MKGFIFGQTSTGLPVPAYAFGHRGPGVLILGGVHGDEIEGPIAAHGLLHAFAKQFSYSLRLFLVPVFNLDGFIAQTRVNGNGVDLNRNLPTRDWDPKAFNKRYPPGPFSGSEPENQALIRFVDSNALHFVISLHSFTRTLLNVNGHCSPEAEILHRLTGYPIEPSIGYPTPGCLGTYTGLERDIPTLTYELKRGLSTEQILRVHVPALLESLKATEDRSFS